jgi:RNA polymerase sigma-70 factor (ECF subfamily)
MSNDRSSAIARLRGTWLQWWQCRTSPTPEVAAVPEPTDPQASLRNINTPWSLLRVANQLSLSKAGDARKSLAHRYGGALRRFVRILVPDEHDAEDVAQELVIRLVAGHFKQADPGRGRFRDLLAVAARNLARNHLEKQRRRAGKYADLDQVAAPAGPDAAEDQLVNTWRNELLRMTWEYLAEYERTHRGSVAHTLLRLRTEYPDDDSEQLAARLSEATGRRIRAEAARQQLRRARVRFAQLLLEELAWSLDDPTPQNVEEELIELGLMEYVRDFLPTDWREKGELRI